MSQKSENTNLASEFYVVSTLHRIGLNPILTIANKKSIDLILINKNKIITIDVKGLRGTTNWLLGKNKPSHKKEYHFYILVTYLNNITDSTRIPECYILPSKKINKYVNPSAKGFVIKYQKLKTEGCQFKENWSILKNIE